MKLVTNDCQTMDQTPEQTDVENTFPKTQLFSRLTIQSKLFMAFILGSIVLFIVCLLVFEEINQSMESTRAVFENNVFLTNLSECLGEIHGDIEEYLSTKSTDSLEDYYRHEQFYQDMLEGLNQETQGSKTDILEKNIYNMSKSYLRLSDKIISAKRGRNVEVYKALFKEETELYEYIQMAIDSLNNTKFADNTVIYGTMSESLKYIEIVSLITMVLVIILTLMIMRLMIHSITGPLTRLAKSAFEVADGNFDVELKEIDQRDEIGIVTSAFIKMIHNTRNYIEQIKRSMETERKMKERELLMETHLKEAQLKYLQAQINPHFLFNSLNAGAQLAMMEDAEKTSIFIEKMADFFRYNVKNTKEDATLEMELETVDNYVYILNVRFSGDIYFEKEVDPAIEQILSEVVLPSMILQPIVENAVNHGIRNVEWEGWIRQKVFWEENYIRIQISDNGLGMTQERIEEVMAGKIKHGDLDSDSTGIGLDNCINRLELFYNEKGLLWIESDGLNQGVTVNVRIPYIYPVEVTENV